jgi:hypothetical protein
MATQNNPDVPERLPLRDEDDYGLLIESIRRYDHAALEQLTRLLSRGVRFLLSRKLHSNDVEGQLKDTLSALVDAIRTGTVNDITQLRQFTLTTLKRQQLEQKPPSEAATGTNQWLVSQFATSTRSHPTERVKILAETIARRMSGAEMEVLRMYYVDGETQEVICRVRCLSDDEFVRINTKAKTVAAS